MNNLNCGKNSVGRCSSVLIVVIDGDEKNVPRDRYGCMSWQQPVEKEDSLGTLMENFWIVSDSLC